MNLITIVIGYVVISGLIAVLFLSLPGIHNIITKKIGQKYNQTYTLASMSLIIIIILKMFYNNEFLLLGTRDSLNVHIIWQMLVAAFFASIPVYLLQPKQKEPHVKHISISLKDFILTGMAMEIPMRALIQNLFIVFGATTVLFGSVTLAIVLNAIVWVQFIILQEVVMKKKRSISLGVVVECMASGWFSIWVGIIYLSTGSIIIAMITHGLQRLIAHVLIKTKNKTQGFSTSAF